jgi:hypothetical protein
MPLLQPLFKRICSRPVLSLIFTEFIFFSEAQIQGSSEQPLQCYACGLPKVHPENDIVGSYGEGLGKKRCVPWVDFSGTSPHFPLEFLDQGKIFMF